MEVKNKLNLKAPLFLASSSKIRLRLLQQIGIYPSFVMSPNINEDVLSEESPGKYTSRIAKNKAMVFKKDYNDCIILSADTAVWCSRKILCKPHDEKQALVFLNMLSGRRHRVYTSFCCLMPNGDCFVKTVVSIIKLKRLSDKEIKQYIVSGEWQGVCGGVDISGTAGAFVEWMRGSYYSILGMPLSQIYKILYGCLIC